MGAGDIRKGIVQSAWNSKAIKKFYEEAALIVIVVGLFTWSWYWATATFFCMSVILLIPKLNYVFSVIMSLFWGLLVGLSIGYFLSPGAGVCLGFLTFVMSIGYHMAAIEYARDMADPKDRNFY